MTNNNDEFSNKIKGESEDLNQNGLIDQNNNRERKEGNEDVEKAEFYGDFRDKEENEDHSELVKEDIDKDTRNKIQEPAIEDLEDFIQLNDEVIENQVSEKEKMDKVSKVKKFKKFVKENRLIIILVSISIILVIILLSVVVSNIDLSEPVSSPVRKVVSSPVADVTTQTKTPTPTKKMISDGEKIFDVPMSSPNKFQLGVYDEVPKNEFLYFTEDDNYYVFWQKSLTRSGEDVKVDYISKVNGNYSSGGKRDYVDLDTPVRFLEKDDDKYISLYEEGFAQKKDMSEIYLGVFMDYESFYGCKVYRIDLEEKVIEYMIGGERVGGKFYYEGAYHILELFEDKYLEISVGACYACGGKVDQFDIIYNVENDSYIELGELVSNDYRYDLDNNTITYTDLVFTSVMEDCMADDCSIYEPIGEAHTVDLP